LIYLGTLKRNNTIEEKIEVGGNILSYCGKCKADSLHIVFAMQESKIGKVTCESCGAKHNYRKPKSLPEDKTASKPSKNTKSPAQRIKKSSKKIDDTLANYDPNTVLNYSMKEDYKESSIIRHSSFGIGIVTKKITTTKVEAQFENGVIKLLAINRTV